MTFAKSSSWLVVKRNFEPTFYFSFWLWVPITSCPKSTHGFLKGLPVLSGRPNPACHLFLPIKFYWSTVMLICFLTSHGYFLTTVAEVRSCSRDHWAAQPRIIPVFSQKKFTNLRRGYQAWLKISFCFYSFCIRPYCQKLKKVELGGKRWERRRKRELTYLSNLGILF